MVCATVSQEGGSRKKNPQVGLEFLPADFERYLHKKLQRAGQNLLLGDIFAKKIFKRAVVHRFAVS